jgi:hypothetical protein
MYTSFYRPFVETCKSLKWKWSIYCTSGWLDALISHQTAGWSNRARGTLRSWQSSTGGVGGRTRPLTRHVRWSMGDPSLCPRRQFQVRKKQCTADPRNNGDDDDDDDDDICVARACIRMHPWTPASPRLDQGPHNGRALEPRNRPGIEHDNDVCSPRALCTAGM